MIEERLKPASGTGHFFRQEFVFILHIRQLLPQLHIFGAQALVQLHELRNFVFQSFEFRFHVHTIIVKIPYSQLVTVRFKSVLIDLAST